MRLLHYQNLDLRRVRSAFEKVRAAIEADDFRSADVKKLHAGPYYRAKLDYANRLLLQFARVGGRSFSSGGNSPNRDGHSNHAAMAPTSCGCPFPFEGRPSSRPGSATGSAGSQ
jgi:hypothetical protein